MYKKQRCCSNYFYICKQPEEKNGDSQQSKQVKTMGSLAATFSSMAVSIGIAMQNATTNQHNGQNIATTCLAQCCKLIIVKGASGGASV